VSALWNVLVRLPDYPSSREQLVVSNSVRSLARAVSQGALTRVPVAPEAISERRGRQLVREFIVRLLEEDSGSRLRPSMLAARLGLSRCHLSRLVTKETGQTITTHVNIVQVLRMVQLLAGTDLPVKQIAWAVGVRDSAEMDRQFRRWIHMPPKLFRAYCFSWPETSWGRSARAARESDAHHTPLR
jgi:AraC-like DNA-binding protein